MTRPFDDLEAWCREYGGESEREGPRTVVCRFDQGTFLKARRTGRGLRGVVNASVRGRPEVIEGHLDVDVEHGLYTVRVGRHVVEPRDTGRGDASTLSAHTASGGGPGVSL